MSLIPPPQVPGFVPTSCTDLQKMGYSMNGIFPVLGKSKLIQMAMCDFSKPDQGKYYSADQPRLIIFQPSYSLKKKK